MIEKVKQIIEEEVRPQLALHQGDIEVLKVEDGVVEVRFLGACSGCPSAKFTVEDIVQAALQKRIPEIKKVVQVYEVSSELWDIAKQILNKRK